MNIPKSKCFIVFEKYWVEAIAWFGGFCLFRVCSRMNGTLF